MPTRSSPSPSRDMPTGSDPSSSALRERSSPRRQTTPKCDSGTSQPERWSDPSRDMPTGSSSSPSGPAESSGTSVAPPPSVPTERFAPRCQTTASCGSGTSRPAVTETTDGESTEIRLQVRNSGRHRAFWLRVDRADDPDDDPLVVVLPWPKAILEPGETADLSVRVSTHAPSGTLLAAFAALLLVLAVVVVFRRSGRSSPPRP